MNTTPTTDGRILTLLSVAQLRHVLTWKLSATEREDVEKHLAWAVAADRCALEQDDDGRDG